MKYYAVKKGWRPGVYASSDMLEKNIVDFKSPIYRVFPSQTEAYDFIFGPFRKSYGVSHELQLTKKYSKWPSTLVVYTDGCKLNKKVAYGFIVVSNGIIIHQEANLIHEQNNTDGEFIAVMKAVEYALHENVKKLFIFHDYAEIRNVLENDKVYDDVVGGYKEKIYDALKTLEIKFIKVTAHRKNCYNEYVDSLVKSVCRKTG